MRVIYIPRIDCTSEHGIKCKQLVNSNHVQCRQTAPAKVQASCLIFSCLVVTIKTVACLWRSRDPANSDSHNIYSLSFQKVCDRCWKECLSHQVESLGTVSHHAFQLLVDEVYSLVFWAAKGSKFVVKVTWLASCYEESYYHEHEAEHGTVATDYLHDDSNFPLLQWPDYFLVVVYFRIWLN